MWLFIRYIWPNSAVGTGNNWHVVLRSDIFVMRSYQMEHIFNSWHKGKAYSEMWFYVYATSGHNVQLKTLVEHFSWHKAYETKFPAVIQNPAMIYKRYLRFLGFGHSDPWCLKKHWAKTWFIKSVFNNLLHFVLERATVTVCVWWYKCRSL